ncbi:outer membrane beta-barrel protein [Winogradskyella sp. R77965]|uniref:outer membrane beta-barrel protein n=1 Tax=Winogradskyella sp. R77965 TaxID=3093872 RepID=UPI0037DD9103
MKIKFLFILTIFIFSFSNAQENNKENGDWFANANIGFTQIEIKNLGTYNGFVFANNIGKEFLFKKNSSLLVGIEFQNIYYDFHSNNSHFHSQNTFVKIPINYRYTSNRNANTSIFVDFGLYGSLLTKNRTDSDLLSESGSNLGSNFGLNFGFGLSQKINDFINFKISINTQSDLIQNYKKENNEIKIKNLYGISFGIGIQL